MLGGITAAQVYIVCGYTDLRRSIDGLAAIVKQNYGINPYNRSLFLFCGRRRDRIKGLLWDEDGFLLLYKRLNDGGFQWPRSEAEMKLLSREQFVWLKYGEAYITDNNLYLLKEDKSIVKINNFVPLVNVKANGEKLTADNGKTLVADIRKKLLSSYPHIENIDLWLTMSFHDFRHTHATNCADDLMPAELLKQRLGHEKIETTYKYYRHRTEKSKQTEMGIINNITTRDYDEVNERLSTEAYFRAEHAVDDRYSSQNHPQTSEEVLGGKFNSQGYYSTSA